ncbi:hypothetical protein ACWERV_23085 [Streptomyces sp. NPDC004031]
MTSTASVKCAEGGDYCGTPTGWRRGGRCRRCRTAHNADLRNSRGLTGQQREHVLRLLRTGRDVDQAAVSAGVTPSLLAGVSSTDGELRAALDGYPEAVQRAARFGDYLAALIRTGGDVPLALQASKITSLSGLVSYRHNDPLFNAAEQAVLQWIDQASQGTTRQVPDELLDHAARLLEDDPTTSLAAVARAIGVANSSSLRYAARRHDRLRAALPPKLRASTKPSVFTPEKDKLLRELWPDKSRSREDIASVLGVSLASLSARVRALELPPRLTFRTGRRGISASRHAPAGPPVEDPACP